MSRQCASGVEVIADTMLRYSHVSFHSGVCTRSQFHRNVDVFYAADGVGGQIGHEQGIEGPRCRQSADWFLEVGVRGRISNKRKAVERYAAAVG
jgi:hypothetical protein